MGSKALKEFEINLYQLDNKRYEFDFSISDKFFESFPNSLIENGRGEVNLILDKSASMMQLHFDIQLETELCCDVSLRNFWHPLRSQKEVIIKFGPEDKELSEDVRIIRSDTQKINVAEYIYEFASLMVPMKKLHPDLEKTDRPDLVYISGDDNKDVDETDPRWDVLKKLKN
jgi:uncharacterized metal-binding protein YceD (DUF177 family)